MVWFPKVGFFLPQAEQPQGCRRHGAWQLFKFSFLPSIEIGNCIAVQVCMLQIPILVLFTIFYVSSPRTAPGVTSCSGVGDTDSTP